MPERPAFEPTAEQRDLIARISAVLETEPRIEAAWLSGSLGNGQGDAFSDVDVLVLVGAGASSAVSADVAKRIGEIAPPALVNSLFGGRVLNVVTEDWQRFDLSFAEGDEIARHDANGLKPLFNRGSRVPTPQDPRPYAPSPEALTKLIEEFLRVLGLSVVGAGRREYVLMQRGANLLRTMAMNRRLEKNCIPPAARGGALHRNPFLTEDQRAELENAPASSATLASALETNRYFAAIFLPRARRLAAESGAAWPTTLEQATRRHLEKHLGLQLA